LYNILLFFQLALVNVKKEDLFMKRKISFLLILLFVLSISLTDAFAQYRPHTQLRLPKGAKARFGKSSIQAIAYSPDGTRLAAATDIGIWIYDAQSGKELNLFAGHTGIILSVAYSPDGRTIMSGGLNHAVDLWDAVTGRYKATLKGHAERVFFRSVFSRRQHYRECK
jgi:WD40 repeat protein